MRELEFVIEDWISANKADDITLASLRIEAGSDPDRIPVTEVFDTFARTIRQHIIVPVQPIVSWLLVNWWRLRWEPQRKTQEWRLAHSMASIGDGYVWPPMEFSSDGEFIHLYLEAERKPDVAAIRYVCDVALSVSAEHFEAAVDELVSQVEERLSACQSDDCDLADLRTELAEERSDPVLSRACRLQAHAGIDPGDAPKGWLDEVERLSQTTGHAAINEVMAVLPDLENGVTTAKQDVEAIRKSPDTLDLSWVGTAQPSSKPELPWQKGSRLAKDLRQHLGLKTDTITDKVLGDRLGVALPLQKRTSGRQLHGGFRNGGANHHTVVLVPTSRPDNQRFYLARLIGCVLLSSSEEHLLPVTGAFTAMQKFERAFAQELLCPWAALDEFTDEHGLDDEGIAGAAEHFNVSERLVLTTLVNKNKLPRDQFELMT